MVTAKGAGAANAALREFIGQHDRGWPDLDFCVRKDGRRLFAERKLIIDWTDRRPSEL